MATAKIPGLAGIPARQFIFAGAAAVSNRHAAAYHNRQTAVVHAAPWRLPALLTGLLLAHLVSPAVVGGTTAVAAGFMVYVALDKLLPAAQTEKQGQLAMRGVILGMAGGRLGGTVPLLAG